MSQELIIAVEEHFKSLPDPRRKTANQRHKFIDVLVIAICGAIICGADGWVAIEKIWYRSRGMVSFFFRTPKRYSFS